MLFEKRTFTWSPSIKPYVTNLIGKMVPLMMERSGRHYLYEVIQHSITSDGESDILFPFFCDITGRSNNYVSSIMFNLNLIIKK